MISVPVQIPLYIIVVYSEDFTLLISNKTFVFTLSVMWVVGRIANCARTSEEKN